MLAASLRRSCCPRVYSKRVNHEAVHRTSVRGCTQEATTPKKEGNTKYWSLARQRQFFNNLAAKFEINDLSGWYNVSVRDIHRNGGSGFLVHDYNDSLILALRTVYPEHEWLEWKFNRVPQNFWASLGNHIKWTQWAAQQLGINDLDDWYNVKREQLRPLGGYGLLAHTYGGSVRQLLAAVYPDHKWLPWLFVKTAPNHWLDKANQREFFEWAGTQLGVRRMEDWYSVPIEKVKKLGASRLLTSQYDSSLQKALPSIFPEHNWSRLRFEQVSNLAYKLSTDALSSGADSPAINETPTVDFPSTNDTNEIVKNVVHAADAASDWSDQSVLRELFLQIHQAAGFSSFDTWYDVPVDAFRQLGILKPYDDKLANAIQFAFPEHKFLPWMFRHTPPGFWNKAENQRWFFDWLGQTSLKFDSMDRWYSITGATIQKNGGGGLLRRHYGGSPIAALKSVYPEHNWLEWKFDCVPRSWWSDPQNQRHFFDWLGTEKLNVRQMTDWYSISSRLLRQNGGGALLVKKYGGSPALALAGVYPEHKWSAWKFHQVPAGYWDTVDDPKLKEIIEEIAAELSVSALDQWYRISLAQLQSIGALSITQRFGGLHAVLRRVYPHYTWESYRFKMTSKLSSQRELVLALKELFPTTVLLESHKIKHDGVLLEFDVFIPSLNLAFEYQGEHHYRDVGSTGESQQKQRMDQLKAAASMKMSISLIQIPYWWDKEQQSLRSIIASSRPELLP